MSQNTTLKMFELNSEVKYKSTFIGCFKIKSSRQINNEIVYSVLNNRGDVRIALHSELEPYHTIEVGDAVILAARRYVVTSVSADKLFAELLGFSGLLPISNLELVPRASAIEFDNAVRKIYGPGSNMLETEDDIKMGDIEMRYGKLICDEIIRARNPRIKR